MENDKQMLNALAELERLFNRYGETYTRETIDEIHANYDFDLLKSLREELRMLQTSVTIR